MCALRSWPLRDMTLSQDHDTPLDQWQQLCEILSQSNLAVRSYDPDVYFAYVCSVALALEIHVWPCVKVMTHPWYPYPTNGSKELWPGHGLWVCVHCDLDLGDVTLGQAHDTTLGHGQQLCEIISRSNLAVRLWPGQKFLGMCALRHRPWRYDLGSRPCYTLRSLTTIVWNFIQIQLSSEELWPGHIFWVCVHFDLDLGDTCMTLSQSHDTPLDHWQQLCEIWSISNMSVRSYGPDTDFRY